jgi:SAM-dependent methyltransferase
MKATASIFRDAIYDEVKKVTLSGRVLDIGGSKKSAYPSLFKGNFSLFVVNIDPQCEPDQIIDAEVVFPFSNGEFDGVVCLNVLEHLFRAEHAFAEAVRVTKSGSRLVFATPFMYYIHGSPDDYARYTASYYRKLAALYGCEISALKPLGVGYFSLGYQCIGGSIPTNLLRQFFKRLAIGTDRVLYRVSKRYRRLADRIPLGFFVILEKK